MARAANGELDRQQLGQEQVKVSMMYVSRMQDIMKRQAELMTMNPAFGQDVKNKLLSDLRDIERAN